MGKGYRHFVPLLQTFPPYRRRYPRPKAGYQQTAGGFRERRGRFSVGSVNEYSTLSSHIQALHRKKIPPGAAPFHHFEDIAIHSFYARVVALFYIRIKALSPGCDIQGPDAVARGPSGSYGHCSP
jgi:hypothetical protein